MKKYFLLIIVICLLFVVGIFGVVLYKYANVDLSEPTHNLSIENTTDNKGDKKHIWLENLANVSKKDFALAANEIYIEYTRPIKEKTKTAYQLNISKNDIYSMFCLTQTLKNSNVNFTIVKDGFSSHVFLNTNDLELLSHIVNELRAYDIHSSVIEVKI